jgi:hypothetical protein
MRWPRELTLQGNVQPEVGERAAIARPRSYQINGWHYDRLVRPNA